MVIATICLSMTEIFLGFITFCISVYRRFCLNMAGIALAMEMILLKMVVVLKKNHVIWIKIQQRIFENTNISGLYAKIAVS